MNILNRFKKTKNNSENDSGYLPSNLQSAFRLSVILGLTIIAFYFIRFSESFSKDEATWGQFGDYIGGILNPLFSMIGIYALLHTIKLQSKELHESTEQLKNSAIALDLQNNVLVRQQFENTFFQLFEVFNQLVKNMLLTTLKDKKNYGREGINKVYFQRIKFVLYSNSTRKNIEKSELKDIEFLLKSLKINVELSAYFRTLYSIIKFVDNSQLPFEDKKFYTNLVRAQLTDAELGLLFYNCLCLPKYEQSKFIPLIIRYDLLEYLQDETLANPQHRQLWNDLIANYQNQ